jgi:hypothetical protein
MERWTGFLIACASLLFVVPSIADEMPDLETLREERNEQLKRYFVRALTQKRLNTAAELLEGGQYAASREKLEEMKFTRLNPYERALAYRFLAYGSMGQEDFAAAVGYFHKVVEQEALAIDDEASVRFNIAQIRSRRSCKSGSNTWSGQTRSPTTCSRSRATGATSTTRR